MINRLKLLFFALTAGGLTHACNSGTGTGEQTLPLTAIVNNPENPNTVFLRITDKKETDTAFLYSVRGLHEGDTVGFTVSLDRHIPAGINEDGSVNNNGFHTGIVKFLSDGTQSDRFIAVLADLWNVEEAADANFSAQAVIPLAFSSNKDTVDHSKASTNNFKLFFDPDGDAPGELFFTVDLYRRGIELQEKDPEFREAIVRALAGLTDSEKEVNDAQADTTLIDSPR